MHGAFDTGATSFGPSRFGAPLLAPATPATTEIRAMAAPGPADHDGDLLHPHNPLLAFAVIAATAFGLMAFSTSVRVGRTKAGITIGDTK